VSGDTATALRLTTIAKSVGLDLVHVPSAAAALMRLEDVGPLLIVIDESADDLPLAVLIRELGIVRRDIPVIALTDEADATETVGAGARAVLTRSAVTERLRDVLAATVAESRATAGQAPATTVDADRLRFVRTYGSLFRRDVKSRELEAAVAAAARTDGPVLITGERGVGKKMVARAIHHLSARAAAPCVRVDCSTVPPIQADTEIFGSEPSAPFSGRGPGRFVQATAGTLVLEEVADLPPEVQAKLAHLLDDGTIHRAGSPTPVRADVRIIATTAKDLPALLASGALRRDLHDKLSQRTIAVPSLRDRPANIGRLAEFFRTTFMEQYRRDTAPLSSAAITRLTNYSWPGNVLELENLLLRYVALGDDEEQLITEIGVRSRLTTSGRRRPLSSPPMDISLRDIGRRAAEEAEMTAILAALEQVQWNRAEAARVLRVSYKTLLNKLNRAGIPGRAWTRSRPDYGGSSEGTGGSHG
jgi:DNA-binding NtrC family response regulator